MGGQSNSSSSTSQSTSVSTNTVTDSFNQAFTNTESLSNVGNITVGGGSMGGMVPILLIGALVAVVILLRKKH